MAIVSSVIIEDKVQIDGRRSVIEKHTDHLSLIYLFCYLAESGTNINLAMTARVSVIDSRLVAREISKDITAILNGEYNKVTSEYAALADIRAALRAFYQTAVGEQVGRMAGYLLTLTDAQLRTIFNMTQTEVNQLKVRLQNRFDNLNAVLSATGE